MENNCENSYINIILMIQIYYICIIKNVHFCPLLSIPYPKSECGQNKKWKKVDVDPPPPPPPPPYCER